MLYIKQIMKLLGVDQATAETIMDNMALDFSEVTTAAFNREAREVYAELLAEVQS